MVEAEAGYSLPAELAEMQPTAGMAHDFRLVLHTWTIINFLGATGELMLHVGT